MRAWRSVRIRFEKFFGYAVVAAFGAGNSFGTMLHFPAPCVALN